MCKTHGGFVNQEAFMKNASSDVSLLKPYTERVGEDLNIGGPFVWYSPQTSYSRISLLNTKQGVQNPNWRAQVRQGLNATTDFSGTKYEHRVVRTGGATLVYLNQFTGARFGTHVSGILHPWSPFTANMDVSQKASADRTALTRFYAAARKAQTQISGPTFLGELRETVQMLKKPASKLGSMTLRYLDRISHPSRRGLRSRVKLPPKEIAQNAAKDWLQYVFGIRPLLNDTEDIAIAIARLLSEPRHTVVRGYADTDCKLAGMSAESGFQQLNWKSRYRVHTSYQVIYRGAIRASAFSDLGVNLAHLRDLLGFRFEEFLPTVYELIPYSFVVDYFSNVGAVLAAESYDSSNLAWVSKTTREISDFAAESFVTSYGGPFQVVSFDQDDHLGKTRTIISSVQRTAVAPHLLDLPLEFHLPGVPGQYANLLALILSKAST